MNEIVKIGGRNFEVCSFFAAEKEIPGHELLSRAAKVGGTPLREDDILFILNNQSEIPKNLRLTTAFVFPELVSERHVQVIFWQVEEWVQGRRYVYSDWRNFWRIIRG